MSLHLILCARLYHARTATQGGWLHALHALPVATARNQLAPRQLVLRARIEQRAACYAALLRLLPLADTHSAKLRARRFSQAEIDRRGYKSTPTGAEGDRIAAQLASCGLEGVPGFYRTGDTWRMVRCRPGFFVPYRDERGRIQAMQYRLDEPLDGKTKYLWLSSRDCSSGAPAHHANHHLLANCAELLVTEGSLKADLVAYFTQTPVIGIAGVSTFGADFAAHLRAVAPAVRSAIVAYDMDLVVKREVRAALEALTAQLERARFRVRVRTWPAEWKGFDDYLLAQWQQQEAHIA